MTLPSDTVPTPVPAQWREWIVNSLPARAVPKNRIALAPAFAHNRSMLARLLSAILTRPFVAPTCRAVALAKAEAYPVEMEVNCGWGDTVIVIVGLPDGPSKSRETAS
jgi:hypothetical protein